MRKIKYRLLVLLFCGIAFTAEVSGPQKFNGFNITSVENQIHYNNPGYELKDVDKEGAQYTKPEMLDAGTLAEPGEPYLPTVSTYYAIEPGKVFSILDVMVLIFSWVFSCICIASEPTARTLFDILSIAMIEGSSTTTEPLLIIKVFAVPRSIARSLLK